MKYSLVIPCFNESKSIPELVSQCKKICNKDTEIVFVNNGSTDNSKELFEILLTDNKNLKFVNVQNNIGYGDGILAGLKETSGDIIGWTHADLQTDPDDFIKALTFFENEKNIFVKGKRKGRPFFDIFFTICMSLFESILLRKLFWDINAQPTVFDRNFYNSWKNPPHDFSIDLFAYNEAKRKGLQIKRFSVFFKKRSHGSSHWNLGFRSKVKFIRRTISYSIELKRRDRN